MVWKEIAVKQYVVRLSAEERAQLNELIRKGKRSAQLLTKARILLKADVSELGEGWSDSRIAVALDTSIATIERTRRQLVEEGFEAVLRRKYNPNSARPRIFDGVAEAKLIALTLSPAPEGFARWSLRLLEEKVVELHIVERASDNTIGRTLKKQSSEPIAKLPSDNWDCGSSRLAMIARRVFCKPALDHGAVDAMHWQFLDAVRLCGVSAVSN